MHITTTCAEKLRYAANWDALHVSSIFDFVDVAFAEGDNLLSVKAISNFIRRTSLSAYLFAPENFHVFMEFALRMTPRVQSLNPGGNQLVDALEYVRKRTPKKQSSRSV
jgi:hypothetical protein